jgi:DNA-binding response OmpR family regulator
MREALVTRGYEVVVARDGAEALSRVELDRPDVMVLDLIMPRRSGFTVLERMQRGGMRSTPVIMMTGTGDQRHRDAATLRGVSVFLDKPFPIEQLLSAVDTIINA